MVTIDEDAMLYLYYFYIDRGFYFYAVQCDALEEVWVHGSVDHPREGIHTYWGDSEGYIGGCDFESIAKLMNELESMMDKCRAKNPNFWDY